MWPCCLRRSLIGSSLQPERRTAGSGDLSAGAYAAVAFMRILRNCARAVAEMPLVVHGRCNQMLRRIEQRRIAHEASPGGPERGGGGDSTESPAPTAVSRQHQHTQAVHQIYTAAGRAQRQTTIAQLRDDMKSMHAVLVCTCGEQHRGMFEQYRMISSSSTSMMRNSGRWRR